MKTNREHMNRKEMIDADGVVRKDINEENAYSGYVEAGDFIFLSFCVGRGTFLQGKPFPQSLHM